MSDVTYKVTRFHFDENHPDHRMTVADGLTLEEAQEHCQSDETSGVDENGNPWFDGYNEEDQ